MNIPYAVKGFEEVVQVNDRIERIKQRLFNDDFMSKKEWWGENTTILDNPEVVKKPLIVRKSLAVRYVAENMPIAVRDDELIVGIPTMASVGFGKCFPSYATEEEKELAQGSSYTEKSVFGHHPANYDKLLRLGLNGIRKEIFESINRFGAEISDETVELYASILISLEALRKLSDRYVQLLLEEAVQCANPVRKAEMFEMARICTRVPENPPESFHEALQSVWMAYVLFHSTMEFLPIGRADQYLWPYLKKDLEEGRIDLNTANELTASWLAKFSERVHLDPHQMEMHMTEKDTIFNGCNPKVVEGSALDAGYANDEEYNFGTSANHWLMNMILGGQDRNGRDATNELTYILLSNWARLELIAPVMSVRLHKNSPQKLYELCADILRRGSGEPVLYNDDAIIPGLVKIGIPLEDARDYSNDGCWETLIPGKTNFGFCNTEILQVMEYLLQDGRSLVRKRKEVDIPYKLEDFPDYESFYSAYLKELENAAVHEIENKIQHRKARSRIAPSPLLSALMDDCIGRGLEYSDGGAEYNFFCFMLTGFSNSVDSLCAIRKYVYDEKKLSLSDLSKVLRENFAGNEVLRQMFINGTPKFGNDDDEVDGIAVRLLEDYEKILASIREKYGSQYIIGGGIATFEFFAKFGHDVGATADGRLAQEALASNYSPSIGMDVSGPTAAIRSATKPNMLSYAIGAPLDLQFRPNEVQGSQGLGRLVALIRTFNELGGLMLTLTGIDEETMRRAQKDPMKYKSLRVRLGGLSAYFVALSPQMQENLIHRTKHIT